MLLILLHLFLMLLPEIFDLVFEPEALQSNPCDIAVAVCDLFFECFVLLGELLYLILEVAFLLLMLEVTIAIEDCCYCLA
jgi:hypothetical protein